MLREIADKRKIITFNKVMPPIGGQEDSRMKDANEHTFMLLGEYVTVETNDAGSFLRVSFGDTQIEDSSGECVDWGPPQRWLILHGAARQSAIRKILQTVAERSIRDFIVMKGEDDDE